MFSKISPTAIVIFMVILVILVLNWNKISATIMPQNSNEEAEGANDPNGGKIFQQIAAFFKSPSDNQPGISCTKLLKKNVSGNEVALLQQWLLNAGAKLPKYGIDGQFGYETGKALKNVTGYGSITLEEAARLINAKIKKLTGTDPGINCATIAQNYK